MSQVTAGETITIDLPTGTIMVKVEDASKSDTILAKVLQSASHAHRIGEVHSFDRNVLKD